METAQVQPVSRKAELRDRIRALEVERSTLESEIVALKEKVEVKELEAYTVSLENQVGTLKIEKTILEERATLPTFSPLSAEVGTSQIVSSFEETGESAAEALPQDDLVQPIIAETSSVVEPTTV